MLWSLKTLVLLSILCPPSSSLCLRLARGRSDLLCPGQMGAGVGGLPPEDDWDSLLRSSAEFHLAANRDKRTSWAGSAKSRSAIRAKLRGSLLRAGVGGGGGGPEERRSRLTLSLDVPTNIMNVLFDVAKAQNLRAKAAENARLLAHVGR